MGHASGRHLLGAVGIDLQGRPVARQFHAASDETRCIKLSGLVVSCP